MLAIFCFLTWVVVTLLLDYICDILQTKIFFKGREIEIAVIHNSSVMFALKREQKNVMIAGEDNTVSKFQWSFAHVSVIRRSLLVRVHKTMVCVTPPHTMWSFIVKCMQYEEYVLGK